MKLGLRAPADTLPVQRRTGERFGRYELVQRLSSGGMAEVFIARCGELDGFSTLVAIKRILPHLRNDTTFIRLFKREARILAGLRHNGIARVIEVGCVEDTWFMALELVAGRSVTRIARTLAGNGQTFTPAVVAYVGAEVARTLEYVHAASFEGRPLGIVHRDISPQNLIIANDGSIKLIDFGIAQGDAGDLKTQTRGAIRGKAPYMSPEQLLGESVDARSDLFSLGVVLWEMATGTRLFGRETGAEGAAAVLRAPISRPPVPAPLADAIMSCLERDLRKRVASAHELASQLAPVARDLDGDAQAVAAMMQALYGTQDEFEAVAQASVQAEDDDPMQDSSPQPVSNERKAVPRRSGLLGLGVVAAAALGLAATLAWSWSPASPSLGRHAHEAREPLRNGGGVVVNALPTVVTSSGAPVAVPVAPTPTPTTVTVTAAQAPRATPTAPSRRKARSPSVRRTSSAPAATQNASTRGRSVLDRLQRSPYEATP